MGRNPNKKDSDREKELYLNYCHAQLADVSSSVIDVQQQSDAVNKNQSYLPVHIVHHWNFLTPVSMDTSLGPFIVVIFRGAYFPLWWRCAALSSIFHLCLTLALFDSSSQCMNSQRG